MTPSFDGAELERWRTSQMLKRRAARVQALLEAKAIAEEAGVSVTDVLLVELRDAVRGLR